MTDLIEHGESDASILSDAVASPVAKVAFKTGLDAMALLAPITGDVATGVDVRTDEIWIAAYYQLRDKRNQLRRQERAANADGEVLSMPNLAWQPVVLQATTLLMQASKDVEIMAWLIEGLMYCHGFAGLHDGLLLLQQLISTYGKQLFPSVDNEKNDDRFSALLALSGDYHEGTLSYPINLSALIFTSEGSMSYWVYTQAQLDKSSGKNSLAMIVRQMDVEQTHTSMQLLENCLNYIDKLETLIATHYAADYFNWIGVRQKLKQCLEAQQRLLNLAYKNQAVSTQPSNDPTATEYDELTALAHIKKAYAIFYQEQPHSPITSSLARILRWADMDLDELVTELIPDQRAQQLFCFITGAHSSSVQARNHEANHNPVARDDEEEFNNFNP